MEKYCFACRTKKDVRKFSADRYNPKDGLATCCTQCNNELYKRMDNKLVYDANNLKAREKEKKRKAEVLRLEKIKEQEYIKAKKQREYDLAMMVQKRDSNT